MAYKILAGAPLREQTATPSQLKCCPLPELVSLLRGSAIYKFVVGEEVLFPRDENISIPSAILNSIREAVSNTDTHQCVVGEMNAGTEQQVVKAFYFEKAYQGPLHSHLPRTRSISLLVTGGVKETVVHNDDRLPETLLRSAGSISVDMGQGVDRHQVSCEAGTVLVHVYQGPNIVHQIDPADSSLRRTQINYTIFPHLAQKPGRHYSARVLNPGQIYYWNQQL